MAPAFREWRARRPAPHHVDDTGGTDRFLAKYPGRPAYAGSVLRFPAFIPFICGRPQCMSERCERSCLRRQTLITLGVSRDRHLALQLAGYRAGYPVPLQLAGYRAGCPVPLQLTGYRAGCPGGESSPRSRPSVSSYSAAAFAFLPGAGDGDRPCHARCGETPAAADSLLPTSCCRGHRPRPAATVPPSRPRSGALHSVVRGAPRGRPARLSGESILTGRRARRRPSVGDQCRRGARRWRHSRRANGADDRRRHRTARPTHPRRRRRRRRHWNVRPGRRDGTVRDCLPDAPPSKDAGPC